MFFILVQNELMGQIPDESSKKMILYYIDPAGSDTRGDGSKNKPWSSLSHACSVVTSGSTIHLNPGKYIESKRCTLAPGVSIEGEGLSSLIISHYVSKDEIDALILLKSSPPGVNGNQSISNLKLDGDLTGTKAIYGYFRNNVTIRNCTIENFASVGIAFKNDIIQNVNGKDNYGWMNGLSSYMQDVFIQNNVIFNNCNNNEIRNSEKVKNFVYENNIYSDPLFLSSSDFHLKPGSPAKKQEQTLD